MMSHLHIRIKKRTSFLHQVSPTRNPLPKITYMWRVTAPVKWPNRNYFQDTQGFTKFDINTPETIKSSIGIRVYIQI